MQREKYFSSKIMRKMRQVDQFQTSFLNKLPVRYKQVVSILLLMQFGRPQVGHTIKTNFILFQTVDPGIQQILIFYKRVWDQLLQQIFCMIFQERYFSCYVLLTDEILLLGCLYFLRYWAICVLQFFVVPSVMPKILKLTIAFLSSCFPT